MAAIDAPAGKLDIGDVIAQTFKTAGRNFLPFFVMCLIVSGIPALVVGLWQMGSATGQTANVNWSLLIPGFLILMVAGIVTQATIIQATVADLNGRKVRITESMAAGLRLFLPLLGLAILMVLGITLGIVLLIVPGIILTILWVVATPVMVMENRGPVASLSRSGDLTKGNRWRIFGLGIVVMILSMIINMIVGGVGAGIAAAATGSVVGSPISVVFNGLASVLTSILTSTGVAVLYVALRRVKEGVGAEDLASVFD